MFRIINAIFYWFIALILLSIANVGPGEAFLAGGGGAMIWWGLESLTERARANRIFNEELDRRLDGERARLLGDDLDPLTAELLLGDVERAADALRKQGVDSRSRPM